jgi:hypothetical protein
MLTCKIDLRYLSAQVMHNSGFKTTGTASPRDLNVSHSKNSTKTGFGGLQDACWPLVPKFAGSNPAEAFGFFRAKKSPALPSEGK